MRSILNALFVLNYKPTFLFAFIAVSAWTNWYYINWTRSTIFSISLYFNQGVNESESSHTFLKQHDQKNTLPPIIENDGMACLIPKLNPFDDSIKKHLKVPKPANCEAGHPLIFNTDLNSTIYEVETPEDYGYFNCCYREFKRQRKDSKFLESKECIKVKNATVVPSESITIYCNKSKGSKIVTLPVDMFNFVHLKPEVEKRVEEWQGRKGKKFHHRRVNVVILGIDAVSHMNFQRIMPRTFKFITEQLNAIGMNGYTKVGDNTFPNIVSTTTGLTKAEFQKLCWKKSTTPVDSCPFIWKNYSANGYRTAFGEDAVPMGAFNYNKRGFYKPPTDYYTNGFNHRMEKLLGHHPLNCCQMCYGPRISLQVSFDFLKAMGIRMGNRRRYFQFIWATSLFHDYLNQGKLGDESLLETLKWFNKENQLENTVFILMSDHGIRWGGIRSTVQGKIEERMPFLYFLLPEWFREQYRPAVSNLIRNRARLTTPFDLHETLLDLLQLENIKESNLNKRYESLQAPKLPRGISLFLPVPAKRTCADAGIDQHWCVCQASVTLQVPNVPIIRTAAVEVVNGINKMLTNFPQCALLTLEVILNAQVIQTENKAINDKSAQITSMDDLRLKRQQFTCSVSFSVSPSNATFEATITRHTNGEWKLGGDISRTNLYGSQSRCVTDYNMKKFCFCF